MNIQRWAIILVLVALLGVTGYTLLEQRNGAVAEIGELSAAVKKLSDENDGLKRDIEYYKNPANLLKVSKARFNYKADGEQMIIVVPETASTTP